MSTLFIAKPNIEKILFIPSFTDHSFSFVYEKWMNKRKIDTYTVDCVWWFLFFFIRQWRWSNPVELASISSNMTSNFSSFAKENLFLSLVAVTHNLWTAKHMIFYVSLMAIFQNGSQSMIAFKFLNPYWFWE